MKPLTLLIIWIVSLAVNLAFFVGCLLIVKAVFGL